MSCACPEHADATAEATGRDPFRERFVLSRRSLLGGAAGALALGAGASLLNTRVAFADGPDYTGDVLVVLSLRGGADGLSIVVPHGDPHLYTNRPGLALPANTLLAGDSMFGLHPAMAPLVPFWNAGTFGAIQACGMANPNRSHFQAMDEMERAAPGTSLRTGWLDRTLGVEGTAAPFQGVALGGSMAPRSLAGPEPVLAMRRLEDFTISGADDAAELATWSTALTALHDHARPELRAPVQSALDAITTTTALNAQDYTPAGGAVYNEDSDLAMALRDLARLIKARVGLQVACVDFGDWDMHTDLGGAGSGWMFDQLTELAAALAAFATDLGPDLNKVTLLTLSEFGRRVPENGSAGVDHGYGNAVLLLGGNVVGGRVHGTWPTLAPDALVDGDLAVTTDYRRVLTEILTTRCGVSSSQAATVFPGAPTAPLGVVRA